jgi:triphosphatase
MNPPAFPDPGTPLPERLGHLTVRLARAARRTRHRADDEAIHDTRVALRRLDAALDVWRDALRPGRRRRARRAVRGLRRSLGPAREAEVNAALLRERMAAEPMATADLETLRTRLERRAERARRRAARACGREEIDRAVRRARRALRPLRAGAPAGSGLLAEARRRLEHRAAVARAALAEAAATGNVEALHRARVTLKRWRYGLEALAGADAGTAVAPAGALEALQGSLGRLHDLTVLREAMEAFAGTGSRPPLSAIVAELERDRQLELAGLTARAELLAVPILALAAAQAPPAGRP